MNSNRIASRSGVVVVAAMAAWQLGAGRAIAQELLWTRERTTANDWYGSAAEIIPDMNGDGRCDVVVGGYGVDCTGIDDGVVELVDAVTGLKMLDWCGDEENAGAMFVAVRDVDGDGVSDIAVSGPSRDDVNGGFDAGRVVLLSGSSGAPIWELVGEQTNDRFGGLAALGDIDGDGFDEILVSSPQQGTLDLGRVYVVSTIDAHVIRSHTGTVAGENLGFAISQCQDVDGDAIVDYALTTTDLNRGRIDLYSGATGVLLWSTLGGVNETFGAPLLDPGDWDGDGRGDLMTLVGIGDGILRVYSPSTDVVLFEFLYQDLHNWFDYWGYRLCNVGDLDGDGVDDIAISAYLDNRDGPDTGRVDLCSGKTLRPLYRFYADGQKRGWFGESLASGGDLNGDGIHDLVVGAPLVRYPKPKGGKVFAFALNDLYLQAEPSAPMDGDTVVVDLRAGPPGLLGLIVLVDLDGTPLFEPLLLAPFDTNGELQLCADVDSSVSGMEFTLMAYAQNRTGRGPLMDASPFVVSVQ